MPPKKKAVKVEEEVSKNDQFEEQLTTAGLSGAMQLVDEEDDNANYELVSTSWPGVNNLVGGEKYAVGGIPKHCHIEVFSEVEHVGKTTLCLQIGVDWQRQGYKVGVFAIESRIPTDYLKQLGYVTDKAEADKLGVYAVRVVQPKVKPEDCTTEMQYAEQILDLLAACSSIFDFLIIDSVDAMCASADAAKSAEEATQMGGISKFLKAYIRKHTYPNATHAWINHMAQGVGPYAPKYTSGGKAIPRYSTLRLKLERVDVLKEGDKDPYGFVTKISTVKNRVSPPFRFTLLSYIFGSAFSPQYDYFKTALKLNILIKNGGWFYIPGEGKNAEERKKNAMWKCQGELNAYRALTSDSEAGKAAWAHIVKMIDGEDVSVDDLPAELTAEEKLKALAMEEEAA